MYIQLSQYSHVHRGRCLPNCLSRNGRSCSKRLQPKQNPTNSFCASLYILYMSCDLQIMANLQKKYRTRVFISRKLTHMLLCVLIFTRGLMSIIYSMVVHATVNFRRIYTVRANIMSVSSRSGAHCTASQCSYM